MAVAEDILSIICSAEISNYDSIYYVVHNMRECDTNSQTIEHRPKGRLNPQNVHLTKLVVTLPVFGIFWWNFQELQEKQVLKQMQL